MSSSNWRDDYHKKLADNEEMGIPEYWIVDYAALGGWAFLGNPKQPTIFIYQLIEGEYQVSQFRKFPGHRLTFHVMWKSREKPNPLTP